MKAKQIEAVKHQQSVVRGKHSSTQPSQGAVETVIELIGPLGQRGKHRGATQLTRGQPQSSKRVNHLRGQEQAIVPDVVNHQISRSYSVQLVMLFVTNVRRGNIIKLFALTCLVKQTLFKKLSYVPRTDTSCHRR